MQNRNRKIKHWAALPLFLFPVNTVIRHLTNKLNVSSHCHDARRVSLLAFPAIVRPCMRRHASSAIDALISLDRNSPALSALCISGRT